MLCFIRNIGLKHNKFSLFDFQIKAYRTFGKKQTFFLHIDFIGSAAGDLQSR